MPYQREYIIFSRKKVVPIDLMSLKPKALKVFYIITFLDEFTTCNENI